MDYTIFENCRENTRENETDTQHMERIIKGAFAPCPDGSKRINDMLTGHLYDCSYEDKTLTLEFTVLDWMRNPAGTLHGGLISTALDMTMGQLSRYFKQATSCVTVSLAVDFMRAVEFGNTFRVTAVADKVGKRMIFLSAKVVNAESGKLAATAKATFM